MNNKNVIAIIQFIFIATLFISCSSKSYYSANNKNLQRFDGWQLETANHLVAINDMEMLIINLSELAGKSAVKKDIYLAANEIKERFGNLKLDTKMEATLQRVTLSTSLSAESDKFYHRLDNTPEDQFDERYKNMTLEKLNELKNIVSDYRENGHSDRIKTLDKKIQGVVEEHISQLTGKKVVQN